MEIKRVSREVFISLVVVLLCVYLGNAMGNFLCSPQGETLAIPAYCGSTVWANTLTVSFFFLIFGIIVSYKHLVSHSAFFISMLIVACFMAILVVSVFEKIPSNPYFEFSLFFFLKGFLGGTLSIALPYGAGFALGYFARKKAPINSVTKT